MRADRLLSLVDLLRRHGQMSSTELARRLEVTPRTVLRDLDVLSTMGVPVYAERGRNGGFALLPGYRPDVSDLSVEESRALLLGGPEVAGALGLGDAFARAARRLAAGLPEDHARQVGWLAERVIVDPGGWDGQVRQPESLEVIFAAVQQDRRLHVDYRALSSGQGGRRTLDPWGLVLAGSTWYLVAAHRRRPHTYRLSRFESVRMLPDRAHRPARLDLLATWQELRASWNRRPSYPITMRVRRDQSDLVQRSLGMVLLDRPLEVIEESPEQVLIRAEVGSLRGMVALFLGFGSWVEVLEPPELRAQMAQIAREALSTYGEN